MEAERAKENEQGGVLKRKNGGKRGAGAPGLTQAPRLGSSIVFLTSLSVSEQTDGDGDSSAPTADASNTSTSVFFNLKKYKTDWTSSGEMKGNTGVYARTWKCALNQMFTFMTHF